MAREEEVILKVSADTSNLDRSIEASENAVKNLGTTGQTVVGGLDRLTGGLASKFVGAAKGVGTFIKGLNLTKVAIAGTGIGLLVLALGAVVTYFTQSFEGARKLKTAMAGVGAAIDVVVDRVSKFGESVVKFFSGDREGAVKAFSEATADLGDELEREIRLAKELETRRQALTDAQREQLVTTAKERSEIKALNLIAEDTTRSISDRIAAADEAGAKERALFEQRKANAEEELAIVMAQNELADSGEEDKQRQAELEAEIFNLAAESLEMQTTLQNKLNTLRTEAANKQKAQREQEEADAQAAADAEKKRIEDEQKAREQAYQDQLKAKQTLEDELYRESLNAREREELIAMEEFDARVALAGDDEGLIQAATEAFYGKIQAIDNRYRQQKNDADDAQAAKDKARDEEIQSVKFEMASQGLAAVSALSTAFASKDEANAERQFKIQKALSLASATVSSTEAVINAYKTAQGSPFTLINPAYPAIQAVLAGVFGAAQIATIARSQFKSPGAPNPGAGGGGGGGGTAGAIQQSPQLDLGFLGAGAGQTGFRSYVIASEVSNSQQANQRINDQASLVG